MNNRSLSERACDLIPRYEELLAKHDGDPLTFHLYHLALYWSRLIGFCKQYQSNPAVCIDGDLGACVKVGSEFIHKLIKADSPIYERWQEYWAQTQNVLNHRPVGIDAVEAAHKTFEKCLAELKYDPWAKPSRE
jgi:hypothetical protein